MLKIQRLNMDNSWWMSWDDHKILIDPWLVGSEIDGASWFNEQWHATPPMPIEELPDYEAIIVSQSYPDHCHIETLQLLNDQVPIFAPKRVGEKIRKKLPQRQIITITEESTGFKGINLSLLDPNRKIDPIYYGIVIELDQEVVLITPHGFSLQETQLQYLKPYSIKLLITTFSDFELPFFLGGKVNPGLKNVNELVGQLKPEVVLNTHDEQKHARGLVTKIAKTHYPDLDKIELEAPSQFIAVKDYELISL